MPTKQDWVERIDSVIAAGDQVVKSAASLDRMLIVANVERFRAMGLELINELFGSKHSRYYYYFFENSDGYNDGTGYNDGITNALSLIVDLREMVATSVNEITPQNMLVEGRRRL